MIDETEDEEYERIDKEIQKDGYPQWVIDACERIDENIDRMGGPMNYISFIKARYQMEAIANGDK